jgi:hypothetical protein
MTTVVTQATGATAKPAGILYVETDLQMPDPGLGSALAQTGVNAAFLSDLSSACLAQERCGLLLYVREEHRQLRDHTSLDVDPPRRRPKQKVVNGLNPGDQSPQLL